MNFLQFHVLTSYPPSNANRDDEGRHKSAKFGGVPRLRLSSQAIKRAIRESSAFQTDLAGNLGIRTKRIGEKIQARLVDEGVAAEDALKAVMMVADVFGKVEPGKAGEESRPRNAALSFITEAEINNAYDMAVKILEGDITEADVKKNKVDIILQDADNAVDVAMFGRMLAGAKHKCREAAVQVSHALTTHAAVGEDDFYAALDDLQAASDPEGNGAAMLGEQEFGSGLFYTYVCVDLGLLLRNLSGDKELAERAIASLVRAIATASPGGMSSSFAHNPRASYIKMTGGSTTPHNFATAFENPIKQPYLRNSVEALDEKAMRFARAYDEQPDLEVVMDVDADVGSLADIREAAMKAVQEV
jgi:CRISPR system Cascade subunit CasC